MDETVKADSEKAFPIRWKRELWDRIEEAAKVLSEREHLDLTPTDIIRRGTAREVDQILGTAA